MTILLRFIYPRVLSFQWVASLVLFGTVSLIAADLPAPRESAVPSASPSPKLPTLFLVSDSTEVRNADAAVGWGVLFSGYFDPAKINLANRAPAERSNKTFFTDGLWEKVAAELKPRDIVLLQFGNDDGGRVDPEKARGALSGLGEETQEITLANGQKQTLHTFGWYLRKFIADTKAKGARPVVLSPTVGGNRQDGEGEHGRSLYAEWSAKIAKAEKVKFIDLTSLIANAYTKLGESKVKEFFSTDPTHSNAVGAGLNAWLALAALKEVGDPPLGAYLSEKGKAVSSADPGLAVVEPFGPRIVLPEPASPELHSLFLVGDSTVRNGQGDGAGGQWGWGEPLAAFFDTSKINVVNRALGGTSSRTYFTRQWEASLALMKRGDFVLIQFGHNDNGALNDTSRARGTIKGVGEESEEIDNLLTKEHEVVHSYGWYLRKYISDARAKGVTPILCSLIPRKTWKEGKIARDRYADWSAEVATSENIGFIDLNALIARRYEQLGEAKVEPLFGDPHTHTSLEGAQLNAECVVSGLKTLNIIPLVNDLSEKGKTVAASSL